MQNASEQKATEPKVIAPGEVFVVPCKVKTRFGVTDAWAVMMCHVKGQAEFLAAFEQRVNARGAAGELASYPGFFWGGFHE